MPRRFKYCKEISIKLRKQSGLFTNDDVLKWINNRYPVYLGNADVVPIRNFLLLWNIFEETVRSLMEATAYSKFQNKVLRPFLKLSSNTEKASSLNYEECFTYFTNRYVQGGQEAEEFQILANRLGSDRATVIEVLLNSNLKLMWKK